MDQRHHRKRKKAPGVDESQFLFDGGGPPPERIVQAWVDEIKSRGAAPVLLCTKLPNAGLAVVEDRSRLEAIRRCGIVDVPVDIIDEFAAAEPGVWSKVGERTREVPIPHP
jgi:hypothetical protein